jgi:hypothetical protein
MSQSYSPSDVVPNETIPGSVEIQSAIDNADAAVQRAAYHKSTEMDMLVSIATAVEQLACGTKQALQAIYDKIA